MAKYEAGKLALIVNARTEKGRQDIGKCVTLVRHIESDSVFVDRERGTRWVTRENECWIVAGDVVSAGNNVQGFALFQQRHLMPLEDPDAQETQTKEREVEKC